MQTWFYSSTPLALNTHISLSESQPSQCLFQRVNSPSRQRPGQMASASIIIVLESGFTNHEACLDQDANSVGFSPESGDGWYNGSTLSATCASCSALCCISWTDPGSATRKLSLFYQTEDKVIHETRFDGLNWTVSSFTQPDAMSGTAMAAIYNENANRVLFFFQDNDGYVSCRRATDWKWEAAIRICIARCGTPIAATSFGDTREIHLLSQQAGLRVQKHCGSFTRISNWQLVLTQVTSQTFGSMAAVSWQGEEIRVYM
ncbi:hypothetical protein B0H14DRAFT_525229 [Mycena olivaceomarginata]|nr:hypothetical protein B0H14DRAFT_525229 [Mycena olivaceomarginata]